MPPSSLLARAQKRGHSIRWFREAALSRYNEAVLLAGAGHRLAAVYLSGYVAEMLLKAAYFRIVGWSVRREILLKDLQKAAREIAPARGVVWAKKGNDLHDLASWRDLLIAERQQQGRAYFAPFQASLITHVTGLALNWNQELRYHTNRPRAAEARMALEAADWLTNQFPLL